MSASRVNSVELAPATIVVARRESRATAVACRVLDLVLAASLLMATLPLLVAIAVAIRLDSPGRALFRQRRLGRNLKPFTVIKFRTMRAGTRDDSHREYMHELISGGGGPRGEDRPLFKLADDERVTRLGHLLRRSSLDELPQLWNVIVGDMSLVGPRPALAYEAERYPPEWFARFGVKPGLTGLWQVSGRSELNVPQAVALDIEYVERRSLWCNFGILARTIPAVLHRRGAA